MMNRISADPRYNLKFTEFNPNDVPELKASDIKFTSRIEPTTHIPEAVFDVHGAECMDVMNNIVDDLIRESNALSESIIVKTLYDFGIKTFDDYLEDLSNGAEIYNSAVDTINERLLNAFNVTPHILPKLPKFHSTDEIYVALDAISKNPYIREHWDATLRSAI